MATKQELIDSYVALGWDIQPLPWRQVSADHLNRVKYDLDVVDPDGEFFTAQVVVTDDGGLNESAVAKGLLAAEVETFEAAARTWLLAEEVRLSDVFAIRIDALYADDELLEAVVYQQLPPDNFLTSQRYLLKRRSGTFSYERMV